MIKGVTQSNPPGGEGQMGHFLERCVCGRIIRQCRCMGPKTETIIENCPHGVDTDSDEE